MKLKLLMWSCVLGLPMSVAAQTTVSIAPDPASKEDVKKLFDVMASREQIRQVMEQLYAQMRTMNREQLKKRRPEITDEELVRLDRQSENLIQRFPLDEMLNDMIPIYQRHFTKSDIEALTGFYSSAIGQKFLHEMPAVTAEAMQATFPRLQAEVERALKQAEAKPDAPQK
jgi:uncharacterized protein